MKELNLIPASAKARVEQALKESLETYMNKLNHGFYQLSVEAPLQLHVMKMLEQKLEQYTLTKEERFVVDVEKNIPLGGRRDEIDGIVEYFLNGQLISQYLIEFKYKKPADGGPNSSNIPSYVDIYELEQQLLTNPLVDGCYFIFVTSDIEFTRPGRRLTSNRMVFPLHEGYTIQTRTYAPMVPAAERQLADLGYTSLTFRKEHNIEYTHVLATSGDEYWYILLNI